MPRLFAEQTCQLFLEKGEDYTEYPLFEKQDRVTSYRDTPAIQEGDQKTITPGADLNADIPIEIVYDYADWGFNGA